MSIVEHQTGMIEKHASAKPEAEAAGHFQRLANAIDKKTAVVGVIGLGYVGLPLLQAFHKAGYPQRPADDTRPPRPYRAGVRKPESTQGILTSCQLL